MDRHAFLWERELEFSEETHLFRLDDHYTITCNGQVNGLRVIAVSVNCITTVPAKI